MITALVVDTDGITAGTLFNAEQALRYLIFLTIGYMISRGLLRPVSASPILRTTERLERHT